MKFSITPGNVKISGRTLYKDGIRFLGYPATYISFRFNGRRATASIISNPENFQQSAMHG